MQAAAGAGATAAAAGSAAGAAAGTAAGSCGNGSEATEAARSRRELARRDIVGAETSSSGAVIWRVGEAGSGAARFMSFDIGEHL